MRRWNDWSIVRLLIFGFVLAATTVLSTIVTRLFIPAAPSPLHQWVVLKNFALPLFLLAAYALTVKKVERRRVDELAPHPGFALFAAGIVLGAAIISAYVIVLLVAGAAHLSPDAGTGAGGLLNLGNEVLVPWLTAVGEELLFRAVIFRVAEEMFGTAAAVVTSAALFALSHAANPGAHYFDLITLAMGMGSVQALAFAATRNLWFPIGLHMGWNLSEGFIFGLPNSGLTDPAPLLHLVITGHPALSGGEFGPEGSVILLVLCLKLSVILLSIALRKQLLQPLTLRMRQPCRDLQGDGAAELA